MKKRIFAAILSASMIVQTAGFPAFATDESYVPATQQNDADQNETLIAKGSLGTASWSLDEQGTLIIGEGEFQNNDPEFRWPWMDYASQIYEIDGTAPFKASGDFSDAFAFGTQAEGSNGETSLVRVDLSGWDVTSVTSLDHLFQGCEKLQELNLEGWNPEETPSAKGIFDFCDSLPEGYALPFVVSSEDDELKSSSDSTDTLSETPILSEEEEKPAPEQDSEISESETSVQSSEEAQESWNLVGWVWNDQQLEIILRIHIDPSQSSYEVPVPQELKLLNSDVYDTQGSLMASAEQSDQTLMIRLQDNAEIDTEKDLDLNLRFDAPSSFVWSVHGTEYEITRTEESDPVSSETCETMIEENEEAHYPSPKAAEKTYTFTQLKEKYKNGWYWTHKVERGKHAWVCFPDYSPDTEANDQCKGAHEGVLQYGKPTVQQRPEIYNNFKSAYSSNNYEGYAFCDGYARLIYDKYHGFKVYDSINSEIWAKGKGKEYADNYEKLGAVSSSTLKPGDFVRFSLGNAPHAAIVTSVSKDGFTVTDCNIDYDCRIRWGAKFTYSGAQVYFIARPRRHFTVVYNANGGSGSMNSTRVPYNISTKTRPNAFKKTGYTMAHWNAYIVSSKKWVYKNAAGNLKAFANDAAAKKEGYTAKAVYRNETPVSTTTSVDNDTVRFYAIWKPNQFTVKYNSNGGSGTMANTTCTYDKTNATRKNTFKKTGYHFTHWYGKHSNGEWVCSRVGTDGKRLWKNFADLATAQKEGYTRHPYGDGTTVSTTTSKNKDTVTFYAQWAINQFTVKYDSNGGSGTMANTTCTYGQTNTTRNNTFTRPGYHFKHWFVRNSNGEWVCSRVGTDGKRLWKSFSDLNQATKEGYAQHPYGNGTIVSTTTSKHNDTITFYAQWEKNPSIASASITGIQEKYTYTGKAIAPKPVVRMGNTTLTEGKDYKLSWSNNVNPGTATITITGIGGYSESIKKTFTIVKAASQNPSQNPPQDPSQKPSPNPGQNPSQNPGQATSGKPISMHRLYNPNSGEHFYTADTSEKDSLVKIGWKYEGEGWKAPQKSSTPVYRLYNANAGDHHYTLNASEKDHLVSVGWKYEGIGWYSDDAKTVPLYRQYNPNAKAGSHNYTTSKQENDALVQLGWKDEGIGWYGMK